MANWKAIINGFLFIATVIHIGFVLSSFLSGGTIKTLTVTTVDENLMPFFTICSNIPVRRKVERIEKYDNNKSFIQNQMENYEHSFEAIFRNVTGIDRFSQIFDTVPIYTPVHISRFDTVFNIDRLTKTNEMDIMNQLMKLNAKERLIFAEQPLLSYNAQINKDFYTERAIYQWIHDFTNNLYYGDCLTIGKDKYHFYDKLDVKHKFRGIKLQIPILHFRNGEHVQEDVAEKYYVMVIHEPYTQPVFDSKNIIKIYPYRSTRISLTVNKLNYEADSTRREAATTLDAIYEESYFGSRTLYYDESYNYTLPNYIYSSEACMVSCLQRLTIKYCKCQLPQFPSDSHFLACRGCKKISQTELDRECICKPPCSYKSYDINVETITDFINMEEEMKRFMAELQLYPIDVRDKYNFLKFYTKLRMNSEIIIEAENPMENNINVIPILKWEIILSQIGGILGTYIGLCLLTFFEIAYDFIGKTIKNCNKKKISKSNCEKTKDINKSAETSSVSLIARLDNSSVYMKIFWLSVLLSASYKTLQQGYWLFQDYAKCEAVIKTETIDQVKFPSVTICSNNPIGKNASNEFKTAYFKSIKTNVKGFQDAMREQGYPDVISMRDAEYHYISTAIEMLQFSKDFRFRNGPKRSSYIKECWYQENYHRMSCKHFHEFEMALLGNCATFNPGLLNYDKDNNLNPNELTMELQFTPPLFAEIFGTLGVTLFIHPKGTSPNAIQMTRAIILKPSFNYTISFSTVKLRIGGRFEGRLGQYKFEDVTQTERFAIKKCPLICQETSHRIVEFQQVAQLSKSEDFDQSYNADDFIIQQDPVYNYSEYYGTFGSTWLTVRPHTLETTVFKEEPAITVNL
ncbi:hypothetical protein CHUAL_006617 [Chamberlinius hualienensis]